MNQLTVKTKVTEGGRIVIPAKMRKALGIKVGKTVTVSLKENNIEITTRELAIRRIEQLMNDNIDPNRSVVDELIRERRDEDANE